jgi:hypothetical protein
MELNLTWSGRILDPFDGFNAVSNFYNNIGAGGGRIVPGGGGPVSGNILVRHLLGSG